MKFGLQLIVQDPPRGERIVRRWEELLELVAVAEDSDFDGVFVPEHHMADDGCLPSPLVALAAFAARTSRIELGASVCLLPFHHPIHVAEEAAMVDVLSNGRVRLGVGLGNLDAGAALFAIDRKSHVGRLEEGIGLVRAAWSGEEFDHAGEHFRAKGRISPLPVAAQLWLAAMSPAGVRRAARLGCPWISDPLHHTAVVSHWADVYRREGEGCGTSASLRVVMVRDGWVADSLEEAERVWWPHARADHFAHLEYVQANPRTLAERDPTLLTIEQERDLRFDRHRGGRLLVGSPADCIEEIEALRRAVEMEYLIMRLKMPTGPTFEEELACIRRFGAEVIPAFRERGQA